MTGTTGERSVDEIRAAVGRICRWMDAHGAPLLVENLAPGATPGRLAQAEIEAATALPEDLITSSFGIVMPSVASGSRRSGQPSTNAFGAKRRCSTSSGKVSRATTKADAPRC